MESQYDILISFRTPDGFKVCGQYFLGKDPNFANALFSNLTGRDDMPEKAILHIDLMETKDSLPVKIKTIGCKFSELCANCEHITRQLFRLHAVGGNQL